jgi:outer membrane protein OmpA-like peptidoglycan-associated protein
VAALFAAACGATVRSSAKPPQTRDTVVLLPDAKGKTGAIVVSGADGKQVLSGPRQAVTVEHGAPPGKPFTMSEDQVRAMVGPALSALPKPPVQFILYFRHDSTDLTGPSQKQFPDILRVIRDRYPVDVSVVGHTDTLGNKRYNDQLALKRARAIADLLSGSGVDPSVLDIASHGKDNPLVPTGDQVSEPRNRRVEVTVR